jgi:hypothetical protein
LAITCHLRFAADDGRVTSSPEARDNLSMHLGVVGVSVELDVRVHASRPSELEEVVQVAGEVGRAEP